MNNAPGNKVPNGTDIEYLEKITRELRVLKEERLRRNAQMSKLLISLLPILYASLATKI